MELLKQFAGEKDDSCLREINFTSGTVLTKEYLSCKFALMYLSIHQRLHSPMAAEPLHGDRFWGTSATSKLFLVMGRSFISQHLQKATVSIR